MPCPGTIAGINLEVGQSTHITFVNANTCAQVGPTGVAISTPHFSTWTADSTGWTVLGTAVGNENITLTPPSGSNLQTLNVGIGVTATPTSITSP